MARKRPRILAILGEGSTSEVCLRPTAGVTLNSCLRIITMKDSISGPSDSLVLENIKLHQNPCDPLLESNIHPLTILASLSQLDLAGHELLITPRW